MRPFIATGESRFLTLISLEFGSKPFATLNRLFGMNIATGMT
jgi:hypothetical protein